MTMGYKRPHGQEETLRRLGFKQLFVAAWVILAAGCAARGLWLWWVS